MMERTYDDGFSNVKSLQFSNKLLPSCVRSVSE